MEGLMARGDARGHGRLLPGGAGAGRRQERPGEGHRLQGAFV